MNMLSRHIEYLLLTHNCVIVPQLGAFVAHEGNARRVESEELFFPPLRVVRFNPELTDDDGLLVGVLRAALHCSATEAKRQVQTMVLQLRQQLLADGQVDFGSIGIFTQDEDGNIGFSSCQAGVTTPTLYGLDAFRMPKLTTLERRDRLADEHKNSSEGFHDTDKHIVIRIPRRALRYAVAVAAVLLIGLFFTPPMQPQRERLVQQATLLFPSTEAPAPEAPAAESTAAKSTAPILVTPSTSAAEATEEEAVIEAPSTEVKPADAAQYAIVLASNVSRKNAERYVADLQLRGYENAAVHDSGKMLRVVLTGFHDETEAYNRNATLHHEGREFASSWVMKL